MLSRFSTIFLLLLAALPVNAATLKGVIIVNEVGGPPMGNVQVGAAAGTTPTVSDSLGIFTLEFPQKQPGEAVRLLVNKAGYVVVNDVQLELELPAKAEDKELTIILSKEVDREEMARRFYRLKSFDAIEETYRKRVKELEDAQQATAAALTKLHQDRDQAKSAAEKASEELAKNQAGQSSELYRQAKRLFLEGKIDEALKLLDDEKLRQSVAQAKQALEDAVQAWLLKAQLLTTQIRFEGAEKAYLQAIEIGPESFEAHIAYGRFNQDLNRFEKARVAYGWCLEWARKNGKNAEAAVTLNNLGLLDRDQKLMDEAQKEFQEALKIERELAREDPDTYLSNVAGTLNNLGTLNNRQGQAEKAKKQFEEALQIYRELAQKDSFEKADVADMLGGVGTLNLEQNRIEEARKQFEEALPIYRELAYQEPQVYLHRVATTLYNLGILDRKQNRMEAAMKRFAEALEIRKSNPDRTAQIPSVEEELRKLRKPDEEAIRGGSPD